MTDKTSRLSAALADRYRIERELGRGGMATVYLAHDIKHDRKVAVKVLRPELAAVLGGDRFLNEITVTANLQHPHILQLYDSGQAVVPPLLSEERGPGSEVPGAGGMFLYYVMPFIEGDSLRARLNAEKQLSIAEAVEITRVIAGALEFAHKRGVIHRDIKPENILLQDGVALIADFGIAVAVATAGGERLTETGLSLGTPAYMSPEQIAGERDLDARSDVYSLACVTYEMLAGDPPFIATNAQAVMAKHIKDTAPPIETTRPNVGGPMARAIARALSKAPADRYPGTAAFAEGLTAEDDLADTGTASVVVLPFANQSPDPDNEFFADGLTEEVIGDLSRLRGLRVISRNSAMTLKGTTKNTRVLAAELQVSHVVTGSVRRAGDALRVTAELVEAATDSPVWNDKYSGTVADVFGIQEEIARKIVAALEVELTAKEEREIGGRAIDDSVAYDCYLRARHEMYHWTPEASQRALRMVDDALAIVGDSPLLLATKAQLLWNEVNTNQVTADVGLVRASEFVDKTLALDPDFPLAIFVRGLVAGSRGNPEAALPDLYRAHSLWPGDSNVLVELCRFSNTAGLRNTGAFVETLVRIDPLSPITPLVVAIYHAVNGRYEEAAVAARRVLEMAPSGSMLGIIAAWGLMEVGFDDEAGEALARVNSTAAGPQRAWALFLKHARDGNAQQAAGLITPEFEPALKSNEVTARTIAQGYALIWRTDDALSWLRAAVDGGFINYPHMAEHDRLLDGIRGDGRFQEILDEVKPRWEAVVEWESRL